MNHRSQNFFYPRWKFPDCYRWRQIDDLSITRCCLPSVIAIKRTLAYWSITSYDVYNSRMTVKNLLTTRRTFFRFQIWHLSNSNENLRRFNETWINEAEIVKTFFRRVSHENSISCSSICSSLVKPHTRRISLIDDRHVFMDLESGNVHVTLRTFSGRKTKLFSRASTRISVSEERKRFSVESVIEWHVRIIRFERSEILLAKFFWWWDRSQTTNDLLTTTLGKMFRVAKQSN